jgi:signal transduction histidine kinase
MLLPQQLKKPRQSLYHFLIIVVILISASSSFYIYKKVDSTSMQHLLDRVNTLGATIPEEQMMQIAGADSDLENPAYQSLKQLMIDVAAANPDIRWVYIIGQREDKSLFIYGDSEDPSSEDYAPPGLPYEEASDKMYQVFEDGKSVTEPTTDRWGSWISAYAPIIDKQTGRVVAFVGIDITANEYMREKLLYSSLPLLVGLFLLTLIYSIQYTRIREFRYVEQKAEFLSIAAHEIRTPLTGIRWVLESFLNEKNSTLTPANRKMLSLVYENCLKLIARINNLLSVTALESIGHGGLKKSEVEIKSFFEEIMNVLALSGQERKVSLVLDPSISPDLKVVLDKDAMRHVFFNLFSNAIKYTNPETSVTISYKKEGGNHLFLVKDQGNGISAEDQQKIFLGYQRTKEAVNSHATGTGLGLFLAKKAVELHRGTLTVSSVKGEGTTFTVTLPDLNA